MSRRNKQRRKRLQNEAREPRAVSSAAAPAVVLPQVPIVVTRAVSGDSSEVEEAPRLAVHRRLIDDLDLTLALEPREDFSSMELDFFRRAELLYAQGPVENFDDLDRS